MECQFMTDFDKGAIKASRTSTSRPSKSEQISDRDAVIKKRAVSALKQLADEWSLGESRPVKAYSKPLSFMVNALFEERDRLKEELDELKKMRNSR